MKGLKEGKERMGVLKDEKLKERKRERGKDDQKDLEERSKVEGWMIKELG
jgi:hypothetical protein